MTGYIKELQDVIRKLHGVDATHAASVPVLEKHGGMTVWEGVVEVFKLHNHPKAEFVYAWSHETDDPNTPRRYVTVLHSGKINTPVAAVRAAIAQEYKDLGTAEES